MNPKRRKFLRERDRNEEQPTVEFGIGPVKVSKIPLKDVIQFLTGPKFIASLIGFIIGSVLTLWAVIQLQQPSWLIRPVISSAVSATITAQPTATPVPTSTPSLVLKLLDASTGTCLLPERGEYKLNPGQRVKIQVEPYGENKMYRWTSYPEDKFEPSRPTGPQVTFIVPEKQNQRIVVGVCELDEYLNCPAGGERTILIRAAASEK